MFIIKFYITVHDLRRTCKITALQSMQQADSNELKLTFDTLWQQKFKYHQKYTHSWVQFHVVWLAWLVPWPIRPTVLNHKVLDDHDIVNHKSTVTA